MTILHVARDRHRDADGRLWVLTRKGWRLYAEKPIPLGEAVILNSYHKRILKRRRACA